MGYAQTMYIDSSDSWCFCPKNRKTQLLRARVWQFFFIFQGTIEQNSAVTTGSSAVWNSWGKLRGPRYQPPDVQHHFFWAAKKRSPKDLWWCRIYLQYDFMMVKLIFEKQHEDESKFGNSTWENCYCTWCLMLLVFVAIDIQKYIKIPHSWLYNDEITISSVQISI